MVERPPTHYPTAKVVCFTRLDADGNLLDDESAAGAGAASSSSSSSSSSGAAARGKRKAAGAGEGGKGKAKKAKGDACDWVGQLKDAEAHFKVCPYAGVRCPYEGCGELVARRDLPDHQETCEYREVPCKWAGCGATFAIDEVAAHEWRCVKREMDCPNQGCRATRIAFDVLAVHRRTCHFERVACPFAGVGCEDRMQRKDVDKHKRAASERHNELLLAKVCGLQQEVNASNDKVSALKEEVNTLKEKVANYEKENLVIRVKHAVLTGAEPFEPEDARSPGRIYSEERVVDRRKFRAFVFRAYVDTDDDRAPDHYGFYLSLCGGPLPFKVKRTFELVHHDGQAASAKKMSGECTFETRKARGYKEFVPKALLADAATSPYVKDGYVTFKCYFEIVV